MIDPISQLQGFGLFLSRHLPLSCCLKLCSSLTGKKTQFVPWIQTSWTEASALAACLSSSLLPPRWVTAGDNLHFLHAQGTAQGLTPAPGTGFLCDAALESLGPRSCSVTSHAPHFPFSGSPSGSFQTFQAHRVLVQWPFSDVLCFAGTSVTTYSTNVLLGEA